MNNKILIGKYILILTVATLAPTLFGCSGNEYDMTSISDNKASGLSILELSPDSGSIYGGTRVTIKGTHFSEGQTLVYFDDYEGDNVQYISSEELEVTTPASDWERTRKIDVRIVVSSPTGDIETTLTNGFTYLSDEPYCEESEDGICTATCETNDSDESCLLIEEVDPDEMYYNESNPEKRVIEISGQNFINEGLEVSIGSLDLTGCSVVDEDAGDLIQCTVPQANHTSIGSKKVTVQVNDESGGKKIAILDNGFTFSDPEAALTPKITKIDPAQGYYDSQDFEVTISGEHFLLDDEDDGSQLTLVYFNDVLADCDVEDIDTIACIPPASDVIGQVSVKVVVKYDDIYREVVLEKGYNYLDYENLVPTIVEINPSLGYSDEETQVIITGTHFVEDHTDVSFGKDDDFYSANDCSISEEGTKITCMAPTSDLIGLVDVKVEVSNEGVDRSVVKQDAFKYESRLSENEEDDDEKNEDEDDEENDDEENDDEESDEDEDDNTSKSNSLTVSKIEPSSARINTKTSFTVWGTGFRKSKMEIKFKDQKATSCVVTKGDKSKAEEDRVDCKTPKVKSSGEYDVTVIAKKTKNRKKEKEELTKSFEFTDPDDEIGKVTITKIEPNMGEANKKTAFKIFGTGFKKKKRMKVKINNITAKCDKVKLDSNSKKDADDSDSDDWIRCKTPKLDVGTYDVEVTVKGKNSGNNKNGTANKKSKNKKKNTEEVVVEEDGFTFSNAEEFYEAPTISSITPNTASENKKTDFKVKGTNFTKNMTVTINNEKATCKTPNLAKKSEKNKSGEAKEDMIKCTTPKLSAGTYDVIITATHNKKNKNSKIKKTYEEKSGFSFTVDDSAKAPEIVSVEYEAAYTKTKNPFTITGYNFSEKRTTVRIGGKKADCGEAIKDLTSGAYTLTCTTPNVEYEGEYALELKKKYREDGKQKTKKITWSNKFTFVNNEIEDSDDEKDPIITKIEDNFAPKKTKKWFTITGSNFKKNKTQIKIGDKSATQCAVNEDKTTVTCKTPKITSKGKYSVKVIVTTKSNKRRTTTLLEGFEIQ